MWETIWETALNSGLWAMLFVGLFITQMRDSKAREEKYQALVDSLAEKLKIVEEIRDDIDEIKNTLFQRIAQQNKRARRGAVRVVQQPLGLFLFRRSSSKLACFFKCKIQNAECRITSLHFVSLTRILILLFFRLSVAGFILHFAFCILHLRSIAPRSAFFILLLHINFYCGKLIQY